LLTVHLDAILGNDQLDALFLNVFILCLYMFRAASAHHQEVQIDSLPCRSRPARQTITHQSVLYQMMY
jgi:hypothetical protein